MCLHDLLSALATLFEFDGNVSGCLRVTALSDLSGELTSGSVTFNRGEGTLVSLPFETGLHPLPSASTSLRSTSP